MMAAWLVWVGAAVAVGGVVGAAEAGGGGGVPVAFEVKGATVEGGLEGGTARLVIQADLAGLGMAKEPGLWSARIQHHLRVERERFRHRFVVDVEALRGGLGEVELPLGGVGTIEAVTGEGLESWSVRLTTNGVRSLVLRTGSGEKVVTSIRVEVTGAHPVTGLGVVTEGLNLSALAPALGSGSVLVEWPAGLAVDVVGAGGLVLVEAGQLPDGLRPVGETVAGGVGGRKAYRFLGSRYTLPIRVRDADPEAGQVVVANFRLEGEVGDGAAAFELTGVARVKDGRGGRLELLAGDVALAEAVERSGWRVRAVGDRYVAEFPEAGEYPLRVRFHAGVRGSNEWKRISFRVAAGALSPVLIRGLGEDTRLELAGASRPERLGDGFGSFLPASGVFEATWRQGREETEGRLFFSAEAVTQVAVSPGLLRQTTLMEMRVMQGEMTRATLLLRGGGEVTRVQGAQVLSWSVEPGDGVGERRVEVRFNQPQREVASVQIQVQQALGAFPLAFEVVQPVPEGAVRVGGYLRLVNEGAVRLEVLESAGLSQISPEQFVQSDAVKGLMPAQATQVFAYRFAGAQVRMRAQADNILPELGVSGILTYHLGETETAVDAELEVDVREAPLRELSLRVPRGYTLAKVEVPGLADQFLSEPAGEAGAVLRLVYGAPVIGRQVVQLRLERNQALGGTRWDLPRVEVMRARSVRGSVGVSADAGFRLTPAATVGLAEQATAFYPKRVAGLQAAFRVNEAAWQAAVTVERLAQSIQADVFHLFSVGEGIAYGSTLVNYLVSGAPVSVLEAELSAEYFNVEFTGRNVRNWQKTERGYRVQLHTPVSGAYTLLATYERPFRAQGETLSFTGVRPVDAQTEQGYTLVISANQFQVVPAQVSGSLSPLEPGEVPAEYRLFFDAPILAAYRYLARPFELQLELKPLAQAEMVSQVVDRAALVTRITEEGQVVTEARYLVKNKGAPHLRLRVPEGAELWSVTVDGKAVVPVRDETGNLIPLPSQPDPNILTELRVKVASRAADARRLSVAAPVVDAPVLLAEWRVSPAGGRRLVYRGGTLTPAAGEPDASGFAGVARVLASEDGGDAVRRALVMVAAAGLGGLVWSGRFGSARRLGVRHLIAGLVGGVAAALAVVMFAGLVGMAEEAVLEVPSELRFVAPVQQGGESWRVDLTQVEAVAGGWVTVGGVFLGLAAVGVWLGALVASGSAMRVLGIAAGWCLLFWAALRAPSGPVPFVTVAGLFLLVQVLVPGLARWWRAAGTTGVPGGGGGSGGVGGSGAITGAGSAVAGWLVAFGVGWMCLGGFGAGLMAAGAAGGVEPLPAWGGTLEPATHVAETVVHEWRVVDDHVRGRAVVRWEGKAGSVLPLFSEPGVLMRSGHPAGTRLVQVQWEGRRVHLLMSETNGTLEFPIEFQARVTERGGERGFVVPVLPGLVNRARLELPGMDVDVGSPQAVLVRREAEEGGSTNTVVGLVMSPKRDAWVGWRPRVRDTRRERAVFYAEWSQMYVPGPGLVEGVHGLQVRPAQGEVGELLFDVPAGMTITDVQGAGLSLWRFDPDTRVLRATFSQAQARPFGLLVRSQVAATPLPFERVVGVIGVRGASGQIGMVGVATGGEVQLDDVGAEGLAAVNLEDFPMPGPAPVSGAGFGVRRAYRYSGEGVVLTLKASAVEADVRVEAQQTLSLGEDRVLLAAVLDVEVTRAGIFKLSFPLPEGMEVESVTGGAMSHWTELRGEGGRVVTLHLKGRTEGRERLNVTLTGGGVRTTNGWVVPRLSMREATKQGGQMLVVPEQGLRVQVARREGATQVEPQQAGARQRGVLAFRLFQEGWVLVLDLEQVDAWVQVTSLQHVEFGEAQAKVSANLQYEIENTGVKTLLVRLPAAAEGVRFCGEQVGDYLMRPGATNAATRDWEVKLERRVLGRQLLQVGYHLPIAEQATVAEVDGVQALGVNLQRGFVTVQAGGRLQVRIDPPAALQPTDWQVIPRALLQDIAAPSANFSYRLVEPAFRLPVALVRHEAARLLPARVNAVELTSVISDDGATLTRVQLRMVPADKRLLHVTLPEGARFWFAFVNQNSVWPWRSTNQVLIPLEQSSRTGEEATVEFFYTGTAGKPGRRSLDLRLAGPRIDLPLEDIRWTVFLSDKWRMDDWSGPLRLQEADVLVEPVVLDLDGYLRSEAERRQEKTRAAEQVLSTANVLLQQGDPQQARRAFKAAFGLSMHDQAFNEDARVQLNNLKLQQALVGINVRQARVAGGGGAQAAALPGLRDGPAANYTQVEAQQLMARNSVEENALQTRLAERLIQQQDAAVSSPAAIRATLPEQGRKLVFTRPLEIEASRELRLEIEASAVRAVTFGWKLMCLGVLLVVAAVLAATVRARE